MKRYVIAGIVDKDKLVGVRVMDIKNRNILNLTNEQLQNVLTRQGNMRNIERTKEQFRWSQGSSKRYPMINVHNPNEVENINSIVVLGVYTDDKGNRKFMITNYRGNITIIEESRLIEYGEKYTIANCKVVTKGTTRYIASIEGSIEEVKNKVEFSYDWEEMEVVAKLPITGASRIEILDRIQGSRVTNPESLYVYPVALANNVTELILGENISRVNKGIFDYIPNLRKLILKGDVEYVNGIYRLKELTEVYINNIGNNTGALFRGLSKLRNVRFKIRPTEYKALMFNDCVSIDFESLMYEGLRGIGQSAFEGCQQIEKVNLPKTLRSLDVTAFAACDNIKEVRINNTSLALNHENQYNSRNVSYKFLSDSPNAVVYCPYSFPIKYLREVVAEHVKIVREEPTEEEKQKIERSHTKVRALGNSVSEFSVASNPRELLGNMRLINEEQWRHSMVEHLKITIIRDGGNRTLTIGDRGSYIQIIMPDIYRYRGVKKPKSLVGKNYAYIETNIGIELIAIGKHVMQKYVENAINNGMGDTIGRYSKHGDTEVFNLEVPRRNIYRDGREIRKVYENGTEIVVETYSGMVEKFSI